MLLKCLENGLPQQIATLFYQLDICKDIAIFLHLFENVLLYYTFLGIFTLQDILSPISQSIFYKMLFQEISVNKLHVRVYII
jgi:hypothetical protein